MSHHSQAIENTDLNNPYLQFITDLDISHKEKIELICIVGAILSHFVDHAFGVQTDQITLGSVGKISSAAPPDHVTIEGDPKTQAACVLSNDVESAFNQLGVRACLESHA